MSESGRVSEGASPRWLLQLFVCSFSPSILRAGVIGFLCEEIPALWAVRAELGSCLHTQWHCQLWLQLMFLEIRFASCKFYQKNWLDFFFLAFKEKKKKAPQFLASLKILKFFLWLLLGGCQKGWCSDPVLV